MFSEDKQCLRVTWLLSFFCVCKLNCVSLSFQLTETTTVASVSVSYIACQGESSVWPSEWLCHE